MPQYKFITDGNFINYYIDAQLVLRLHNSSRHVQWSYNDSGGINYTIDTLRFQIDNLNEIYFDGVQLGSQGDFETKIIELFPGLAGGDPTPGIDDVTGEAAGKILSNDGIRTLWANPISVLNASGNAFSSAHGSLQIGDKFYIGTTGGQIIVFNDPADLSDYVIKNIQPDGLNYIASMCYDSVAELIYATVKSTTDVFLFGIISINPDDITDYDLVFSTNTIEGGLFPAIVTDNTNVYGVSFSSPAKFFKIQISDWTLLSSVTWTGANQGHSAQINTVNGEFYCTNGEDAGKFAKVDCTDLSYEELDISDLVSFPGDDLVFVANVEVGGGLCYVASENSGKGGAMIDIVTMLATGFDIVPSYGIFRGPEGLLYNLGLNGFIQTFNEDLSDMKTYIASGFRPNEFFYSSEGKLFFTTYGTDGGLVEFNFSNNAKFEPPNPITGKATLVSGTVTVNTTEVTADSVIQITLNTPSGTLGPSYSVPDASIIPGTSFVINAVGTTGVVTTTDNSTINWVLIN